ncbi:hypothetical protein HDV00_007793 [Rhizophlyctis rosea]|nr:hypothetical protein HDV00_007793 [Rhizophlyctis rosea]
MVTLNTSLLVRKVSVLAILAASFLLPTSVHAAEYEAERFLTKAQQQEAEYVSSRTIPLTNLTYSDRLLLLAHYAPIVRLHPRDPWRPADPEEVFKASEVLTSDEDLELRVQMGGENPKEDAEIPELVDGTLSVPDRLHHGNAVTDDAEVKARITAQVVQYGFGNRTYLQYWTYYPVNGCQGFRTGIYDGLRTFVRERAENFEWCNMAYHNGDWEHITIQLEGVWNGLSVDTIPKIDKVFFSQHMDGHWHPAKHLSFHNTHPIIYAALNSHANYPIEGTHKNDDAAFNFVSRITPALTLGAVQRIQLADVCDLDSALYMYDKPDGNWGKFVQWKTWEVGFWDLSSRTQWPGFAWFSGRWGLPVDQTVFLAPPEGVSARMQLYGALKTAKKLGVLKKFVHAHERAPWGPRQHKAWYNLDRPFDLR